MNAILFSSSVTLAAVAIALLVPLVCVCIALLKADKYRRAVLDTKPIEVLEGIVAQGSLLLFGMLIFWLFGGVSLVGVWSIFRSGVEPSVSGGLTHSVFNFGMAILGAFVGCLAFFWSLHALRACREIKNAFPQLLSTGTHLL